MKNLPALIEGLAPVVKGYVDSEVDRRVALGVKAAMAELVIPAGERGPQGEKGLDGKDGAPGESIKGDPGDPGEPGRDGSPGEPGAKGDPGKDGADGVNGKDGRDGIDGKDGAPGKDGERGADGVNGKDGRDGINGKDGTSVTLEDVLPALEGVVARAVLDFERRATDVLHRAVANIPAPKDGVDGLSVDDLEVTLKGDRTIVLSLTKADGTKVAREVELKGLPVYQGTFQSRREYAKGDNVTYGGSVWLALKDTDTAPPGDAWRMIVKGTR